MIPYWIPRRSGEVSHGLGCVSLLPDSGGALRAGPVPGRPLSAEARPRGSRAMTKAPLPAAPPGEAADAASWIERELAGCRFQDNRLDQRLHKLLTHMASAIGGSLPLACQDWANAKAAYRFLSNPNVSEHEILRGHFQATRSRFAAVDGPILVIQDTTELSDERAQHDRIGATRRVNSGRDKAGRLRMHTVCGLLMHSCLAVTTAGLPLGLSAIKFWTRPQFKGTRTLNRKINPTRVPIDQKESIRGLACMRQSVALFGAPERCIQHTIADEMAEVKIKGRHQVDVHTAQGDVSSAILELKYRRIHVLPPI